MDAETQAQNERVRAEYEIALARQEIPDVARAYVDALLDLAAVQDRALRHAIAVLRGEPV